MPKPPEVLAKTLIATVDLLRDEAGGALPTPRAVRDKVGGSHERATAAILAVEIRSGITPHLRATLPADFKAELPPPASIESLTPATLAGLPSRTRATAERFFATIGEQYAQEMRTMQTTYAAATAEYVEQTTSLQERLRDGARQADELARVADENAARYAAERAELRERLAAAQSDIRAAERETGLRTEMLDAARASARANEEKQAKEIERLMSELAEERETCRTAQQAVAGLTAANEALRADNARLITEKTAASENTPGVRTAKRPRAKVGAK